MTFNEHSFNFYENTYLTPFEISNIEFDNDKIFNPYLQNYVDILSNIIETTPVQMAEIIRPYDNNVESSMKLKNTYR